MRYLRGYLPLLGLILAGCVHEEAPLVLELRDNQFQTRELRIKRDLATTILFDNQNPSLEELEILSLGIEKKTPAGTQLRIDLPPLSPGRYPFQIEKHTATAFGVIIVE